MKNTQHRVTSWKFAAVFQSFWLCWPRFDIMYDIEMTFFYVFCKDQSTIALTALLFSNPPPEKTEVLNNSLSLSMWPLAGGGLNK